MKQNCISPLTNGNVISGNCVSLPESKKEKKTSLSLKWEVNNLVFVIVVPISNIKYLIIV